MLLIGVVVQVRDLILQPGPVDAGVAALLETSLLAGVIQAVARSGGARAGSEGPLSSPGALVSGFLDQACVAWGVAV